MTHRRLTSTLVGASLRIRDWRFPPACCIPTALHAPTQPFVTQDYHTLSANTQTFLNLALESHDKLLQSHDVVVIEGAGSCTELNLMNRDISNLPLLRLLGSTSTSSAVPWLLVANIDPGGVFAQIIGTMACVSEMDWEACVGIVVNRLRGDPRFFEPGPAILQERVGKPIFVVPFLSNLALPEEDSMSLEHKIDRNNEQYKSSGDSVNHNAVVVVVCYPNISMTDDLLPVELDARFQVEWRRNSLPSSKTYPTAIVLPGSKQTCQDLEWLSATPWKEYILDFASHCAKTAGTSGRILGVCGGFQMLGESIVDVEGVEGPGEPGRKSVGLGLLPAVTQLVSPKVVRPVRNAILQLGQDRNTGKKGMALPNDSLFEIHCGQTWCTNVNAIAEDDATVLPLLRILEKDEDGNGSYTTQWDGLTNGQNIHGTYLHGILQSRQARSLLLLGEDPDEPQQRHVLGEEDNQTHDTDPLDRLAAHLESCGLDFATLSGFLNEKFDQQEQ